MDFEGVNSPSLSSSSCHDINVGATNSSSPSSTTNEQQQPLLSRKRKAGRRKFKETRHPVYRGVRRRNGNKWVCEMREPNKKTRIWLGTFPTPEMAARAHDVAAQALRGDDAELNFADSVWCTPRPRSSSARDIQIAAFQAAEAFRPSIEQADSSSSLLSTGLPGGDREEKMDDETEDVAENGDEGVSMLFMDEEAVFNMPVLIDSMAEGMLLTPPAMKKGFHYWDDMGNDIELTLWTY